MKLTPVFVFLLRVLTFVFVVGVGITLIALALGGCTLIYIEGDGNRIDDTGGHGGGLSVPTQQPTLRDRLNGLKPND